MRNMFHCQSRAPIEWEWKRGEPGEPLYSLPPSREDVKFCKPLAPLSSLSARLYTTASTATALILLFIYTPSCIIMRFSSLAVLSLASAAVAADLKTWNDVVGDVPSCIKTCLDTFYSSAGLEDKCGSPDSADVTCVCGMSGSASDYQDDATKLSSCIQDKCETSELADAVSSLKGFMERFQSLEGECEGSSSSSSSSGSKKGTLLSNL